MRWIQRLLNLTTKHDDKIDSDEMVRDARIMKAVNKTIRSVSKDIEDASFNTCIAHLMTLTGVLETLKRDSESMSKLATMLYPFAPLAAAEIYAMSLSDTDDIRLASWPVVVDAKKGAVIVVQRNGRKWGPWKFKTTSVRKR